MMGGAIQAHRIAALLAALAAALALAGCGGTARSAHTDDLESQRGESGVTVFGDIDVGVGRQRAR